MIILFYFKYRVSWVETHTLHNHGSLERREEKKENTEADEFIYNVRLTERDRELFGARLKIKSRINIY